MSETVLAVAHESESRAWDAVVEGDRLMAMDWLRRARGIAAAWSSARAVGREEFVSCEVAAALCVEDRTALTLIAEARMLTELPALCEAVAAGSLRLPHAKVLLAELLPVSTSVALEVLSEVLGKVGERTPEQVRGIVRRAVIRVDADAAARRRREAVLGRRVFTRAEPDGMALFGAQLPAPDALEAYALVDARARSYDRDDRTADQRRAHALLDLLRRRRGGCSVATQRRRDRPRDRGPRVLRRAGRALRLRFDRRRAGARAHHRRGAAQGVRRCRHRRGAGGGVHDGAPAWLGGATPSPG